MKMLFRGNSSRLELLIEKIQATKEGSDIVAMAESTTSTGGPSSPRSGTQTPVAGRSSSEDAEGYPYQCSYCKYTFSRNALLVEHEQTHSEHLQFTCSYCPRLFKHKRSRDRHTKLHTGDKKYKCQQCESAFSRSDHLKIHMKTHDSRKPYKCGTCNRGYNTAAALSSHQQSHLKEESRSGSRTSGGSTPSPALYRCNVCLEIFTKLDVIQNHVNMVHNGAESPSTQTSDQVVTEFEPQPEEIKIVCMYCSKDFSSLDLMYQHVEIAHRDVQNGRTPNKSLSSPNMQYSPKQEIVQNGTPTYACDRCTMQFDSIPSLKDHVNNVHWRPILSAASIKDYNFGFIQNFGLEKSFSPFQTQPTDLSRNKRKEDPNEKSAKKRKHDLNNRHSPSTMSPYDTNDKPCICSCCYAQLPNFKSFLEHMETHMPFSNNALLGYCPVCGEPGRDPVSFTNHIFGHAIAQESGRCCYSCKKSFERNEELQKHLIETHVLSVYKCSICNEIFDTKMSMQLHLTSKHSDECKHFKCYLCSHQVFHDRLSAELHISTKHYHQFAPSATSQSLLRTQYQVELDARLKEYGLTFQCTFCKKSFKDQYSHYLHLLKEHNDAREGEKYLLEATIQQQNPPTSPSFMFPSTLSSPDNNPKIDGKLTETYNCEICNRTDINSEADLLAHKKLHHSKTKIGSVSLQCAYCNEYCKSRSDLENHMKTHQVSCGKGKHKCNICDEIYSTALILADHKLTHCKIVEGNNCVQCKAVLGDEQSFYSHQLQHSNSPAKPNSQISLPANCVICCQTLQTDVEIKLHAKFHLKHLLQKEFICGVCNKIFDTQSGLIVNVPSEKSPDNLTVSLCKDCKLKNNNTPIAFTPDNELKKIKPQGKKYACIQCPQTFDCESEVQTHAAMHVLNEGTNLECRLCKQIFTSPLKLQTHLIEHNFYGMNQYSCYVCSSVFTAASGLQSHIIGHGLDSRPYECSQCQMKFFFRTELDNHRFIHMMHSPTNKPPTPNYPSNNAGDPLCDNRRSPQYKICKYCSNSYLDNSFFVEHLNQCPFRVSPKKEIFDSQTEVSIDNKVKEINEEVKDIIVKKEEGESRMNERQ